MKPFKDPIAPKSRKADKNFVAPTKEGATTGRFMPPGDDYGVGFRTPVGTEKVSSKEVIPMKSKCFSPDDTI
jgi:hypothetical protein